ncbi:hypothetical protein [Microcoleus sp. S13_C5]|uniref:hypothetical protein n=1 Tax=Microcoleus sp. S13_C5 TaxID=3055411 RepID=UPI002FCF958C
MPRNPVSLPSGLLLYKPQTELRDAQLGKCPRHVLRTLRDRLNATVHAGWRSDIVERQAAIENFF